MGIKDKYRKTRKFIAEDVWNVELETLGSFRRKFVQSIKVTVLTIRTFNSQKIGFQSVALSFFCTMAVVPFIAVALALTKGLGLSDKLEALLYANFPNSPDVIQSVMIYADNIIQRASSSVLGFISAAFFVWLVIWMMLCVERVFNNVWRVRKNRRFVTRFGRDVVIVIVAPLLMLLQYFGAIMLSGAIPSNSLKWILMIPMSILVFSLMYKYIPNTKVYYKNALKASVASALAFTAIQFIYVESQIFLTRLSGIYGAVAAIPFFMFWLNFSWFAILVGAELSYAFQNVDKINVDSI